MVKKTFDEFYGIVDCGLNWSIHLAGDRKVLDLKVRFITALLGFMFLYIQSVSVAAATPEVTAIRLGLHQDKTRFVIELSEKPVYNIFFLPNPYRLVIDMQEVSWKTGTKKKRKTGIIENYRYGLFRQGTSRIVLDLKSPAKILRQAVLPPAEGKPYRFFIDVQKTTEAIFREAVVQSRKRQVALAPPVTEVVPDVKKGRKVNIVIDAGHGGIDPGAIGKSGVYEKTLTLQVAKRLRDKLKKNPRYNPIMTRATDVFLSLRERVSVARRYKGDLFISIHADSISRPDVRGSTVYTLSETASDDEAAALAKSHNKSDVIAGVDLQDQDNTVQGILIDLAQRETMNFSVKFAKILIPEISRSGIRVVSRSHRYAGFRVLKAPDVPSVLVELGYLSNRQDEKMLKSRKGQVKLTASIANAVDKYFDEIKP